MGTSAAEAEAINTVSRITRVPADMADNGGRTPDSQLHKNPVPTHRATALSAFTGGMMMARNMPYSATLRALTSRPGSRLPMMIPRAVPTAQDGTDTAMAP